MKVESYIDGKKVMDAETLEFTPLEMIDKKEFDVSDRFVD
jgi:hypothetical protein